jgi:hypothetical protein
MLKNLISVTLGISAFLIASSVNAADCPTRLLPGQTQTYAGKSCLGKSAGEDNRYCTNTYITTKRGENYLCQIRESKCVPSHKKCKTPS